MKRLVTGIVIAAFVVVVGCGGLVTSNGGDAGTDRDATSHLDSGAVDSGQGDGGRGHTHDAATDVQARDSGRDASLCSGGWSVSPSIDGGHVEVSSVWGSGPNDVWAVGGYSSGEILHFDGTAWSVSTLPTNDGGALPGVFGNLYSGPSVWGSGPNDVWAVGRNAILHWNGSAWSALAVPDGGGVPPSSGQNIWGSGPNDVWILTGGLGLSIAHWDGSVWSNAPVLPLLRSGDSGGYCPLNTVGGTGPSDVWAVGSSAVLHWNGSAWSTNVACDDPSGVGGNAVWGSGPNDVWVTNGYGLQHWDGTAWSGSAVPSLGAGAGGVLSAVWGSGPNDVWAVGGAGGSTIDGLILGSGWIVHWEGTAWSFSPLPDAGSRVLSGVWGSGSCDVWAVGGHNGILHYP